MVNDARAQPNWQINEHYLMKKKSTYTFLSFFSMLGSTLTNLLHIQKVNYAFTLFIKPVAHIGP